MPNSSQNILSDADLWKAFCDAHEKDNTVAKCSITLAPMLHPVTLAGDGRTYEKEEIVKWLSTHNTSPMTNEELTLEDKKLIRAYSVEETTEAAFQKFKEKHKARSMKQKTQNSPKSQNEDVQEDESLVKGIDDFTVIAFKNTIHQIIISNPSLVEFKMAVIDSDLINDILFDKRRALYLMRILNDEWKTQFNLPQTLLDSMNGAIVSFVKNNLTKQEASDQVMAYFGNFMDSQFQKAQPHLFKFIIEIFKSETAKQYENKQSQRYTVSLDEPKEEKPLEIRRASAVRAVSNNNDNETSNAIPKKHNANNYNTGIFNAPSVIKVKLLGDDGVGKSSLLRRWADNEFSENFIGSTGYDFKIRNLEVFGMDIQLQVWDAPSRYRFRTVTTQCYAGGHVGVYIVDMTDMMSFKNLEAILLKHEIMPNGPKILVANKCDLTYKRVLEHEQLKEFAEKNGMIGPFYTSAKNGQLVDEVFQKAAEAVLRLLMPAKSIANDKHPNNDSGSCNVM